MLNEKTEVRYLDYLTVYTNTILEYSEELKKKCKKKSSGEAKVNGEKYTYFGTSKWITILNKKNYLEISFSFNDNIDSVFFYKTKFHDFIESDLNANGLWRNFTSNSIVREKEFNECFDNLCTSWKITKKDNWFVIWTNQI